MPAAARIEIWAARITEGDLWVMGNGADANSSVTLDETFNEKADSRGGFEFRIPYHPATCMVVLKSGTESRAVVVANCGQTGPRGESGPPGPAGPPGPPGPAPVASSTPAAEGASGLPPAAAAAIPSGPAGQACGTRAAQYGAETGAKIWITRRGSMSQQNALRPTAGQARAIVLQVAIDGRTAAAYGPGFEAMQQGGSPDQLEQESGNPIEWSRTIDPLPESIQIVGSGGGVVARLKFEQCGTAPKTHSEAARPSRRRQEPATAEAANPDVPRGLTLPRGAIEDLPAPR